MERCFDDDHDTIYLSKLKKIIVQFNPENGLSLDTLLEKHKQKLIKRSKRNRFPNGVYIPREGFRCLDCSSSDLFVNAEMFEWHCLAK